MGCCSLNIVPCNVRKKEERKEYAAKEENLGKKWLMSFHIQWHDTSFPACLQHVWGSSYISRNKQICKRQRAFTQTQCEDRGHGAFSHCCQEQRFQRMACFQLKTSNSTPMFWLFLSDGSTSRARPGCSVKICCLYGAAAGVGAQRGQLVWIRLGVYHLTSWCRRP